MATRLDVFISSTLNDLRQYRSVVRDTVFRLGLFPIGVEDFDTTTGNALSTSYSMIQEAELFIGIYAYQYGYIPPAGILYPNGRSDGEKSILHFEYLWAKERNIPMFIFLLREDVAWNIDHVPRNASEIDRMKAFKEILTQHIVGFFDSPNELAVQVAQAIFSATKENQIDWRPPRPPELARFIGRENEIGTISRIVSRPKARLVLTGMGGIGKTTVALAVASSLSTHFEGGVFWAQLGSNVQDVVSIWDDWKNATAAGRNTNAKDVSPSNMKEWLSQSQSPILVILDDAKYNDLLRTILDALPQNCSLLITTRERDLHVYIESQRFDLQPLSEYDILRWMRSRLPYAEGVPTESLRELVHLLGFNTLAVELALHQLSNFASPNTRSSDIDRLIQSLRNQFRPNGFATDLPTTLSPILTQTYTGLPREAQDAFRLLGAIPVDMDFAVEMAAAIWGYDFTDDKQLTDVQVRLNTLLRFGLIEKKDSNRYQMHDLLHDFAVSLLKESHSLEDAAKIYMIALERAWWQLLRKPAEEWSFAKAFLQHFELHTTPNHPLLKSLNDVVLPPAKTVFLSHSHVDKNFVNRVAALLRSQRINVFNSSDGSIPSGDQWLTVIQDVLPKSTHFVLVISPEAINSGWVRREMDAALQQEVAGMLKIIPVWFRQCDQLPVFWTAYHRLDLSHEDLFDNGVRDLIERIKTT